jgi:hypothetical protein
MIRIALPLVALALSACDPAVPPQTPPGPPTACSSEKVADLIGKRRNYELETQVKARTGAERIRWIKPGDAVTMDFSETRLNLHTNRSGKLIRATCG